MCTTVAVHSQQLITYCTVLVGVRTCTLYRVYIYGRERVQDEKKQERQKCPAGTRQTDGKNWGLVWRNRKKISQIVKDYFLLIILWPPSSTLLSLWLLAACRHLSCIVRSLIDILFMIEDNCLLAGQRSLIPKPNSHLFPLSATPYNDCFSAARRHTL